MKNIYSLILFVFLLSQSVYGQVSEQEFQALKALYNATDGDNWTKRNGWETINTTATKDSVTRDWDGILILEEGHIRMLELYKANISGSLPPEIGGLAWLEKLRLGSNKIKGPIPAEIVNMNKLKVLNLAYNPIGGEFPEVIGNMTELERLSLNRCQLSGEIPLSWANLTNLVELDLAYDTINTALPGEIIGNMENLQILELDQCGFYGKLPNMFDSLQHLTDLDLYGNHFSGELPQSINNLPNLETISLTKNQFEGALPALTASNGLESARFSINNFSGVVPDNYKDFPELDILYCSYNNLSGALPRELIEAVNKIGFDHNYYTFEQVEPLVDILDYSTDLIFPLKQQELEFEAGEIQELNASSLSVFNLGGNNNRYKWYKDNVEIYSGNNPVYTIDLVENSDAGIYRFEVRNTIVDDLVLQSENISVSVAGLNQIAIGINLSASSVNENYSGLVAELSAIDADTLDIHTFTLVSGDGTNDYDNELFDISGSELNLNTPVDFEQVDTLHIRISTNDGNGGIYIANHKIAVNDINEAPVFGEQSTVASIDETAPEGQEIFVLEGNDPEGETVSYSITAGNDDGVFAIENDTLKLADNSSLNYDIKNEYSLEITISDGVQTSASNFTIRLNKITDVPIARDMEFSITTYLPEGGIIGIIEATDPENDSLYFTIISGNESGMVSLSADTIKVADNDLFNAQPERQFVLTVEVSDGTNQTSITIIINVSLATNIHDSWKQQIMAFPNPAANRLCIENIDKDSMIYIYSLTGTLMNIVHATDTKVEISFSGVQPGIYIIKAIANKNPYLLRVIKK